MAHDDDEILAEFLAESREHLAGIETDLLAMEEAGADIDEELVNRVFRAAHSIKGGAGFFGLRTIQELAHRAETVLDMIRDREMVPNGEVVNLLLGAFDQLRELIDAPATSGDVDISAHVVALTGLAASFLPAAEKPAVSQPAALPALGRPSPITLSEIDLVRARKAGHFVYLAEYDLIHDVERWGITPLDVIRMITAQGTILDACLNTEAVGTLDDEPTNRLPFEVLLTLPLDPLSAPRMLGLPAEKVRCLEAPAPRS